MPDRRLAWSLIFLAIFARAAAVLVLQSHLIPHSTYEHGEIAANILDGRGFSVKFLGADGPTSQQAPLYPALVALAYSLGGVGTPRALLILELGQAVLGGLLVAAVLMLAREVAPGRKWVATAAALIVAIHPTLVYTATHVQVASLATVLLTFTLAWGHRTARVPSPRHALITGLLLALLILTDPILGLAALGIALAVVVNQGMKIALKPLAIVSLTAIVALLPWTIRNAQVHGELVFIKSTFGYAFWQGNCALSQGTDKVVRPSVKLALDQPSSPLDLRAQNSALWLARHQAGYLDDIALSPEDYRTLSRLSEPARSRLLFQRALSNLRAEPGRYTRLCLRRLRYFVLFDETNPKTSSFLYRAPHLALSTLALIGLILTPPETRKRLAPTLLTAALLTTFHALTIVSTRFHIPLEPLLALWSASGLSRWTLTETGTAPSPHPSIALARYQRRSWTNSVC